MHTNASLPKKVLILYGYVGSDAPADELDVLVQVSAVAAALAELGHEVVELALTLDLESAVQKIRNESPDIIFNLVESLSGSDRLLSIGTLLCDHLGIPYTGSPTDAIAASSNKSTAKAIMRSSGIPTPPWATASQVLCGNTGIRFPAIAKSSVDHASIGITVGSIFNSETALCACLKQLPRQRTASIFAESFIDGREFNLSVLEMQSGPQVLPVAEIRFDAFPPGKPRIVDYKAKWQEHSFEYKNTVRSFEFEAHDSALLEKLKATALDCWQLFGMRGYARVDFRVDSENNVWVLETNANPCLSPDAGFVAAAARHGLSYAELIDYIIRAAVSN